MSSTIDYSGQSFISPARHDTYPFIDPLKLSLSGKRVFISGASKGIGRALAISYAKAGASKIAIAARSDLTSHTQEVIDAATEAGREKPRVLALSLDVSSWESVKKAAERVDAEFDGLDVLVNNAGYLSDFSKIADADPGPEGWWKDFEVNVKGVFFAEKAFIPTLLKGGLRTIVNISSIGAQGIGHGSAYKTAKLAVNRLTEHTVEEYKGEGLLAFAIHPAAVNTDLARGMPDAMHHVLIDTPQLPADTIVFLSSERREWLAGRYLSSNWDMENLLKEESRVVKGDLLKVKLQLQ